MLEILMEHFPTSQLSFSTIELLKDTISQILQFENIDNS